MPLIRFGMLALKCMVAMTIAMGFTAIAQNDDSQNQTDQLKKEKLEAEKALADLQNQKALADAWKDLADSQKALADSQTHAAIAKTIGDVKGGPYSGSVEMKEQAGTEEAALLAARAVKEASKIVAAAVRADNRKFYIFASKELPSFQRLASFRLRVELLKQAFAAAKVSPPESLRPMAVPELAAAGLDALSNLLGFFKTDFTVGGLEVKLDESLLLFSVAGELAAPSDSHVKPCEAHLAMLYHPGVQNGSVQTLIDELTPLVNLRLTAFQEAKRATEDAKIDRMNAAIALFDAFVKSLNTPDSNGVVPLTGIAQELAIDTALQAGSYVLLLKLENSGGGYLIKKNLWTGLFAVNPLFHTGGATVAYVLLAGGTGQVVKGDVVPIHGGFVKSSKLREALRK